MKEAFFTLVESMRESRKKCPWSKEQSIESYKEQIISEAKEIAEAIEKNDMENLKEELGDMIMDVIFLGIVAEEQGHFDLKEVLATVTEKLKRRKPWVFGEMEGVKTLEDALAVWNEIKKKEKMEK